VDYYNEQGVAGTVATQSQSGEMPPNHPPTSTVNEKEITDAVAAADQKTGDFEAQQSAAKLLYRAGRLDQALAYYERANKLRPDDYESTVGMGNVHFDLGITHSQDQQSDDSTKHFLEAARWYERALEKNPTDVNVRTDLGLTYYYRRPQNLDQAISHYRQSLKVQPDHPQTLSNIIIALSEQGGLDEAMSILAKLEQLSPDSMLLAQTLFSTSTALSGKGKLDEADALLVKLEKIAPGVPAVAQLREEITARRKGEKIQSH
jgi:tetratricopeptide (TPR) repeat protein